MDKTTPAPQKISASEYRWTKKLSLDEVWTLGWKEDYFRWFYLRNKLLIKIKNIENLNTIIKNLLWSIIYIYIYFY